MGNGDSTMDEQEWRSKIETTRLRKYGGDGYQLFIQYLTDPQSISNDIIANIARVVRAYATNTLSMTLCDFTQYPQKSPTEPCNHTLEGIKVSIAIHPISGELFIADQAHVYKYIRFNHLQPIAKLPSLATSTPDRITDLTFDANGDQLHYMLNNNLTAVYSLPYDDDKKIKISFYDFYRKSSQTMNIFKFDFTHFYLSNVCVQKYFQNLPVCGVRQPEIVKEAQSRVWCDGTLYSIDMYRNEMWLVRNNDSQPPMLYRIKINTADNTMTLVDSVEIIDEDMTYVVAFDVDKYFGGVYLISYNKILYRMQPSSNDSKEWKITRKKHLKDLIDNELPVGIYTIRYDSVMGRIIIADNYKIQAVYL